MARCTRPHVARGLRALAGQAPTVSFGGVPASYVVVVGSNWIQGRIPSSPAGACPTNVTVAYGGIVLTLPGAFCYANYGLPHPAAAVGALPRALLGARLAERNSQAARGVREALASR